MIALVHHADAVGPEIDPQRPLSSRGLLQATALAEEARNYGIRPAAIWHSGKLRARQTADAFYRACNPLAEFKMVRGLRPEDPPSWMRDELAAEERDLLLVSHMPLLPGLVALLLPGAGAFPLHGLIVLEKDPAGGWIERWRAL